LKNSRRYGKRGTGKGASAQTAHIAEDDVHSDSAIENDSFTKSFGDAIRIITELRDKYTQLRREYCHLARVNSAKDEENAILHKQVDMMKRFKKNYLRQLNLHNSQYLPPSSSARSTIQPPTDQPHVPSPRIPSPLNSNGNNLSRRRRFDKSIVLESPMSVNTEKGNKEAAQNLSSPALNFERNSHSFFPSQEHHGRCSTSSLTSASSSESDSDSSSNDQGTPANGEGEGTEKSSEEPEQPSNMPVNQEQPLPRNARLLAAKKEKAEKRAARLLAAQKTKAKRAAAKVAQAEQRISASLEPGREQLEVISDN
jgi:hypothetical protein